MGTSVASGTMRKIRLAAALALAAALSACISDDAAVVHSVWRAAAPQPAKLSVYYVTDREADPAMPGGFGKHWADAPSCGVARVSVPPANLPDEKPADATIIAGKTLACAGGKAAMTGIAAAIAAEAQQNHCNSVLLYVHGFNTAFYSAVDRAAQLALDTQSGCAVAAFSWSSEGNLNRYAADIEHSAYAEPVLEALLKDLASSGIRVDIVAHSMGNRLVLGALSSFAERGDAIQSRFIGQLVLAAADVGVEPVNDDFLHLLRNAMAYAQRTTIYASAGDAVLVISKTAHGGVARAGREPQSDRQYQTLASAPIVDTIDASDAPGDTLGHSYYALSYEAISDIAQVLAGVAAKDRALAKNGKPATLFCEADCGGPAPAYALDIASRRKPSLIVRLTRFLVPIIPWI